MKKLMSFLLVISLTLSAFSLCSVFAESEAPLRAADEAEPEATPVPTEVPNPLLAFPGAEGGGKYTKGARGALDNGGKVEVYHVTSLDADGPGTLADAVGDGVTTGDDSETVGRIVVFDVGGIIDVPDTLYINRNNITLLGQTAPGDGITLTGGDLRIGNGRKNVMIRYMRVRPTNKNGGEYDGIGGQWNQDVIIDHCSTSWFVDEGLTLYAGSAENATYKQGQRLTVQDTITAESMRLSGHFKGAHGYGGILGGTNATYYRNLFAHHDSRSPRLDRVLQKTDIQNNVIYNWGVTNSAYGGEPTSPHNQVLNPSKINYANNFYSYGPSTRTDRRPRIFDLSGLAKTVDDKTYKSQFYMEGNYVEGVQTSTDNNWSSDATNKGADQVERMTEPFSLGDALYPNLNVSEIISGKEVRDAILPGIGATLPKRDATDARIIADAKNRTGRIINNSDEVGGISGFETVKKDFVIPEEWKDQNNMGDAKDEDIIASGEKAGYTWIEAYVNDWTEEQSKTLPTNPEVIVTSPAIASVNSKVGGTTVNNGKWTVINDTQTVSYKAQATPVGNTKITKMELWDGPNVIKTYEDAAVIDDTISLGIGEHYLSCVAYNDAGESTRSTTSIVYVNGSTVPEGWEMKTIGSPAFGAGSASVDENGIYTIGGSGKIGGKSDTCNFMYKKVTGNFDISLKMEDIMGNENGPVMGLMVRNTLDANSISAAVVDGWIKLGRNPRIVARTSKGGELATDPDETNSTDMKTGIFFKDKDGGVISANVLGEYNDGNKTGYNWLPGEAHELPNYLRIQRDGNNLVFSVSNGGTDYTDNIRQPYIMNIPGLADEMCIGVAIDSHQGQSDASPKQYYSMAGFSDLKVDNKSNFEGLPTPEPTPTPAPTVEPNIAAQYDVWQDGASRENGELGENEVVYKDGEAALYVKTFNVYQELAEPYSSGVVNFDFDVYVDKDVDRNFRVYFENKTGNWQNGENVFAEIINNANSQINKGPGLDNRENPFVTYDQIGGSGWVHFDTSIDYDKVGTDEFITMTASKKDGTVLGTTTMGSIASKDTTLCSVRLVSTAESVYFANMKLGRELVNDKVFYVSKPAMEGRAVKASIRNTSGQNAMFIAAAYDTSGALADAKVVSVPNSDTDFTVSGMEFDKDYTDIRFFLWNEGTFEPYANVK